MTRYVYIITLLVTAMIVVGSATAVHAQDDVWLERYANRVSSMFVQRPLDRLERQALKEQGQAGLRRVIAGWQDDPGLQVAARVYVQTLLGLSGATEAINGELAGNLAAHLVKENRPWTELITKTKCIGDDGEATACDAKAPYTAGVLTLRSFLKHNAGRFNLHRANVMLKTFACKAYPVADELEPRTPMSSLTELFARTGDGDTEGLDFGNGNKCYSCHGQFAWHTQLFVKFDASGVYNAYADGRQDPSKQPGDSTQDTFASHFKSGSKAASERSQFLGKKVDDLADAARELAASSVFVDCSFENLLNFGLGLGGSREEKASAALLEDLRRALGKESPTFIDLVSELFSHPEVIAAARGK